MCKLRGARAAKPEMLPYSSQNKAILLRARGKYKGGLTDFAFFWQGSYLFPIDKGCKMAS
jgi:hypothetical protein